MAGSRARGHLKKGKEERKEGESLVLYLFFLMTFGMKIDGLGEEEDGSFQ